MVCEVEGNQFLISALTQRRQNVLLKMLSSKKFPSLINLEGKEVKDLKILTIADICCYTGKDPESGEIFSMSEFFTVLEHFQLAIRKEGKNFQIVSESASNKSPIPLVSQKGNSTGLELADVLKAKNLLLALMIKDLLGAEKILNFCRKNPSYKWAKICSKNFFAIVERKSLLLSTIN